MALTPQQKILHVSNELGITDMKNMQATTRSLYHSQNIVTGAGAALPNIKFFGDTLTNAIPIRETNVPAGSKLQVNEALLVEKIMFNEVSTTGTGGARTYAGWQRRDCIVNFYIANKRVLKDVRLSINQYFFSGPANQYYNTVELFLEGAGILIPPQVEFYVETRWQENLSNVPVSPVGNTGEIMCSLYGTGVLLNLNTTL